MTLAVAHAGTKLHDCPPLHTLTHTGTHITQAIAHTHPISHMHATTHTQAHTQPRSQYLTHNHTHTHSLTVPSSTQRGADAGEVWDWPPALSPAALKGPGNTSLLFPPSPLIFLTPGGSKPLLINHHRQILTEENNSGKTFTLLKMSLV